jgi:Zn-dependent protease with chaperone function
VTGPEPVLRTSSETCPKCGSIVPAEFGYVSWCECGWNLTPPKATRPPGRVDRLLANAGTKAGLRLHDRVRRDGDVTARFDVPVVVSWVLAISIHLMTLGLAVFAVWLAVISGFNPIAIVIDLVIGLFLWTIRPRFLRWPDGEILATRTAMPELLALVDRVSAAVGGRPVDRVYIAPDYNASFSQYGWRRRSGLRIGLPLFAALEGQERVALLGHEVAHGVNRDPARGFIIGSASRSAFELYRVLHPGRLISRRPSIGEYFAIPFVLVQLALAEGVWFVFVVLVRSASQASQRAEYRADLIAAQVAGRAAALAMTERLYLGRTVGRMTWVAQVGDPVDEIVQKVRGTPSRELERIRRIERLAGSRLDYQHPPTVYRISVLEALPPLAPAVVLDSITSDRIDVELRPAHAPIGRQIVADYLMRISR